MMRNFALISALSGTLSSDAQTQSLCENIVSPNTKLPDAILGLNIVSSTSAEACSSASSCRGARGSRLIPIWPIDPINAFLEGFLRTAAAMSVLTTWF